MNHEADSPLKKGASKEDLHVESHDLLGALDDLFEMNLSDGLSEASIDQDEQMLMKIKFADNIITRHNNNTMKTIAEEEAEFLSQKIIWI